MTATLDAVVEACPLRHVAIIMDGNNRWARQRGLSGSAGHRAGVDRIRDTLDACQQHGVEVLTLFGFSSENWRRPGAEVRALMALFATYLRKETAELRRRKIRLRIIGERCRFSPRLQKLIVDAERATAVSDPALTLVLAVDYGGRWDMVQAARQLAIQVSAGELTPADITEALLGSALCLGDLPPPDLCIRTAGEQRISNFLLWQLAYTEFHFAACYWPDFYGAAFDEAVAEYHRRQRKFGRNDPQPASPRHRSA